jgi:hypothetical protein
VSPPTIQTPSQHTLFQKPHPTSYHVSSKKTKPTPHASPSTNPIPSSCVHLSKKPHPISCAPSRNLILCHTYVSSQGTLPISARPLPQTSSSVKQIHSSGGPPGTTRPVGGMHGEITQELSEEHLFHIPDTCVSYVFKRTESNDTSS